MLRTGSGHGRMDSRITASVNDYPPGSEYVDQGFRVTVSLIHQDQDICLPSRDRHLRCFRPPPKDQYPAPPEVDYQKLNPFKIEIVVLDVWPFFLSLAWQEHRCVKFVPCTKISQV